MKTKFFAVATEGSTVDGREITAKQIKEMAKSYNLDKYGARVWNEHIRGLLPNGLFKALGDVLAVKTQKNTEGKLQLLAQIHPTADLVKMNQDRQKVYTSIEIHPNFQDTGKAYLMGLAVTDSPASTGTDMLKFSKQSPLLNAAIEKGIAAGDIQTVSQPIETSFTMSQENTDLNNAQPAEDKTLFSVFSGMFKSKEQDAEDKAKQNAEKQAFSEDLEKTLGLFAEKIKALEATEDKYNSLKQEHDALQNEFNALKDALKKTKTDDHSDRPDANGGDAITVDC